MKTLLLIGYLLLLILGAAVLGWLARWYKYGGRCGPGGLKDGIPNIDTEARTVTLDGSEPALAIEAKTSEAAQKATESTRAALGTLKAGYADGRKAGAMPDTPGDDSTAARLAAVAGSVATKVETGLSSASEAVKEKAARMAGSAKSTADSVKDGFAGGKAKGDASDATTDGSIAAKVGAAVGGAAATVGTGAAKVSEGAKDAAASAGESTRSTLASVKDGFAEGKASGETPDAPADGSVAAKVGATVGAAPAAVAEGAAKVSESVKDAAASAGESTRSTLASVKDGFAVGKAPGETPDAPADGSVAAKVGAVVGGAAAAVGTGVAKATETVKDAAATAGESTKSTLASVKDGFAEGKAPGETPDAPADGSIAAKIGAAVGGTAAAVGVVGARSSGRDEGDVSDRDRTGSASAIRASIDPQGSGTGAATLYSPENTADVTGGFDDDTVLDERSRELAGRAGSTLGQEDGYTTGLEDGQSGAGAMAVDIPDALSDDEAQAKRLIDSGSEVSRPASALMSPHMGRSPDDLTQIKGIGNATQQTLNEEGIFYFDQIAAFGAPDIAWADKTLAFNGRVVRDRWVPQAKGLAQGAGGEAGSAPMRQRFAALAAEAESDTADGSGMDAGVIDIPEALSDAEAEAQRLIDEGGEVTAPETALDAPQQGRAPDDLKLISGVGPKIETTLNEKGIYYFDQIAGFGGRDLAWADQTLGFRGRVIRDRWVPQARVLAEQRARLENEPGAGQGPAVSSGATPGNTPLKLVEAEALRLLEQEGGYKATEANRPAMLMTDGPAVGKADDLRRIRGIGDTLQVLLNGTGIHYFRQIAGMSAEDIAWIDRKLNFKGRIVRDRWVPQAEKFERGKND